MKNVSDGQDEEILRRDPQNGTHRISLAKQLSLLLISATSDERIHVIQITPAFPRPLKTGVANAGASADLGLAARRESTR